MQSSFHESDSDSDSNPIFNDPDISDEEYSELKKLEIQDLFEEKIHQKLLDDAICRGDIIADEWFPPTTIVIPFEKKQEATVISNNTPVYLGKTVKQCRFMARCNNKNCTFSHKKPLCRYKEQCNNRLCEFDHDDQTE